MPNKPTTLREVEKLVNWFYKVDLILDDSDLDSFHDKSIVTKHAEEFLTSHNTELISKIEGLKTDAIFNNLTGTPEGWEIIERRKIHNNALDEVINIINQYK